MNLIERFVTYFEPLIAPLTELLLFLALLIPTFVILAAAAVSLAHTDPSVAIPAPVQTAAACEPCPGYALDD